MCPILSASPTLCPIAQHSWLNIMLYHEDKPNSVASWNSLSYDVSPDSRLARLPRLPRPRHRVSRLSCMDARATKCKWRPSRLTPPTTAPAQETQSCSSARPPSAPRSPPHLLGRIRMRGSFGRDTPLAPRGVSAPPTTIHGPWPPRSHLAHGCISLNRPRTGREARCSASSRCPTPRKRWEAKGCCRPRRPRSSGKPRSPLRRA